MLFSSCLVTQKKYTLLLENRNRLEGHNLQLQQQIQDRENNTAVISQNQQYEALKKEYTQLKSEFAELQSSTDAITEQNEKLASENEMLTDKIAKEKKQTEAQILANADESMTENQIEETDQKASEKDDIMIELQAQVENALVEFIDTNLRIEILDGTVSIALPQNLLFAVGSATIDSMGSKAINSILPVLDQNPSVRVTVEGHTDPDGAESRNWDLSVLRSTAVVKKLIGGGLEGSRITASGRAFYDPIVENNNWENKARNRRIEIILTPAS